MSTARHAVAAPARQVGMSLVELLVGLVIGLLTVLAIVQLMSTYSRQQRLTGADNEALSSAMIALNTISQDVQRGGHAITHQRLQNCGTFLSLVDGVAAPDFSTTAVSITDGGTGPDRLTVRFAESVRGDVPLALSADMANATDNLNVASTFGVLANDLVLVSNNANQCTLRQVSGFGGTPVALLAQPTASPNFNPSGTPTGWVTYTTAMGSQVFTLGKFTQRTYSVVPASQILSARDFLGTVDNPVADTIVDLQAQYGITSGLVSNSVTEWVDATSGWSSLDASERKRIKAIRIAIVARTTEADSSNPSAGMTLVLWPAVATSAGQQGSPARSFTPTGADTRYRYRVLRTVVPLKNMLWSEVS